MGDNDQKPTAAQKRKERRETLSSKIDRWLSVEDDGSDLYLSAVNRQTLNQPATKKNS